MKYFPKNFTLFSFFVNFADDNITNEYMDRIFKHVLKITVAAVFILLGTSCLGPDNVMYEDGDFDGASFMEEDMIHNAEIDMDDLYRD